MTLTYEHALPENHATIVDPLGDTAVCCFWTRPRDADPYLHAALRARLRPERKIAVIGNSFHDRPAARSWAAADMKRSAARVTCALRWNPQVRWLALYGTLEQCEAFLGALDVVNEESGCVGLPVATSGPDELSWQPGGDLTDAGDALGLMEVSVWRTGNDGRFAFPMPKPQAPDLYPSRYRAGFMLHGSNLTILHAEVLATALRYGRWRGGRLELSNVVACWHAPFELGPKFEPDVEQLQAYAEGKGTAKQQYLGRFCAEANLRYHPVTDPSDGKRRNYYPIWVPGDELADDDAPCLTGVTIWDDTITGTFRAHNLVHGWPQNAYLLRHFHQIRAGHPAQTVVMHSVQAGIAEGSLDEARELAAKYAWSDKPIISDAAGAWSVERDREDRIVAQLMTPGGTVTEFAARQEQAVRKKILRAGAIPQDPSETLYLGSEIGKRAVASDLERLAVYDELARKARTSEASSVEIRDAIAAMAPKDGPGDPAR